MTARELFESIAPVLAPRLELEFERRDLCILATRVALEVAAYYGVEAEAAPVRCMAYNAAFARHVAEEFQGVREIAVREWGDDSWSVGIGYGYKPGQPTEGRWNGHLIVVADGCFADFSIGQAERLERGIVLGTALVGPYGGEEMWKAENSRGTVVEYHRVPDGGEFRKAPDWQDAKRRRAIVGELIRAVCPKAVCQ